MFGIRVALSTLVVTQLLLTQSPLRVSGQHHHFSLEDVSNLNETQLGSETFIPEESSSRCVPKKIPFCAEANYTLIHLPNLLNQMSQVEIETELNVYYPLIKAGCSKYLRLFLCTVYAPMCFEQGGGTDIQLVPCQSLCESVRQGCAEQIAQLVNHWPVALRCNKFPNGKDGNICVGNETDNALIESTNEPSSVPRNLSFVCPKNFVVNSYSLHLNGKTYNNCAMPCEDVYLNKPSARLVGLITGVLAITCFISTVFTCFTFLIDTKRFQYPARPIIIIAFCQLVVATCYLVGYLSHNRIACNEPAEPLLPNIKMIRTTTMGNKKGSCTLQFMALYFFQMATVLWWLMMTISWYMIARLKWAPEAVSSMARYFHLFSWTIPALLTIYISALGAIEGDSLTGTCHVNSSDQESVAKFIITPMIICLVSGCVFLSLGFKSIWETREILRREYGCKQTDEHYKLVTRIGLYSFLVIIFTTLFIYSHHYEQINQTVWKLAWLSNICQNREYSLPCPVNDFRLQGPHYSTFVLKYIATMAIGIISAGFMFSQKTIKAYCDVAELVNYKL